MSNQAEKEKLSVRKAVEKVPTLAELSLSKSELRRLRGDGIKLKKKLKVGKAGITEGIVNGIHERWRRSEVVKIECEDLCRLNMKRTHDLLERKTGGLVVWRSGSIIVLYRGENYKYPYFLIDENSRNDTSNDALLDHNDAKERCLPNMAGVKSAESSPNNKGTQPSLIKGVGSPNRVRFIMPGEAQLAEEADHLLDGLGPRFTDWWGYEPLPVDADLLPAIVPGYRRPFRLLPYGVKPKLTNDEMTILRRLGRPLPCHFALGRNRKLQGLATSIVKLWGKCEIAKIAVKRGVQNTNSEIMAEELARLTGGTLIARDREFIVFYRGKDFLPPAISSAIEERRKYAIHREKQKTVCSTAVITTQEPKLRTIEVASEDEHDVTHYQKKDHLSEQRKPRSTEVSIKRTSIKLSMALEKKERAEELLTALENEENLQGPEIDKEGITEEERYMLRKVGLRMKPFLLLGRRGVFDGTVENMHLHWKYRELVKVISKERSYEDVHGAAQTLAAESGGILVAVERVNKGHAIIVYRGKNYERPASLRPQTLLNKKEAMKRSLEAQRRESLKLHVLELTRNVDELKTQLAVDKETNSIKSLEELTLPLKVKEKQRADSPSINSNDGVDVSKMSLEIIQQDNQIDLSSNYEDETDKLELKSPSESVLEHTSLNGDNGTKQPLVEPSNKELEPSIHKAIENRSNIRGAPLSNRDRLLLRKQALMMKKRPVLAVGKSNIVTGVAKTIKEHFKKYPLAIVNIKGRAKGTSVQEVVSKLEEATGGVLVSQEPSKVILYRGWGAGEKPGKKNTRRDGGEGGVQPSVSPQLMAAIRFECGFESKLEIGSTL